DCCGTQVLRTGKDVEPDELERLRQAREQSRDLLRVDAELLRAAGHLHARGLQLEVGVDANRDSTLAARRCGERSQATQLAGTLDVHRDACSQRALQVQQRLAGARKADRAR